MRLTLISFLFISSTSFSQTNWTGAMDSDWNNPLNWSSIPMNGDSLVIDPVNLSGSMSFPVLSLESTFVPQSIYLKNAGTLMVQDTLTVSGNFHITDNAHLNSIHGTIRVQNNLFIRTGGVVFSDSSFFAIDNSLHIADGSVLMSSNFQLHESDLVIQGKLLYDNFMYGYFPTLEMENCTFQLNNQLIINSAVSNPSGQARLKMRNSQAKLYGDILKMTVYQTPFLMQVSDTSELIFHGVTITLASSADTIILSNNSNWIHDVLGPPSTSGFSIGNYLASDSRTEFTNGVSMGGNLQFHDLICDSTSAMGTASNVKISGDFVLDCWHIFYGGLTFNGSELQHVSGIMDSLLVESDFVLNNTGAGVMLGMDLHIDGSVSAVDLIDGVLYAPENNEVYLHDVAWGMFCDFSNSYVQGYINSDRGFFPLGWQGSGSRPLNFPYRYGEWMRATYELGTPPSCDVNSPMIGTDTLGCWKISPSDSTEEYRLEVMWNDTTQIQPGNYFNATIANRSIAGGNCEWNLVPSTHSFVYSSTIDGDVFKSSFELSGEQLITMGFTENLYQFDSIACQGIDWVLNGHSYTSTGTFIDSVNADSVLMIHLDVIPVDTSVTFDLHHIYSQAPSGSVTYRWLNCNTGLEIPNQYGPTLTITQNGSYAIIVRNVGDLYQCADTGTCVIISQLGLEELDQSNSIVYPNPLEISEMLNIHSPVILTSLILYDLDNKLIEEIRLDDNSEVKIKLSTQTTGIYLLKLVGIDGSFSYKKIIIQ